MKIAVIGSGLAGLATCKTFSQKGHQVTVFEKASTIGGVYLHTLDRKIRLTSSKFITVFSDFPMPDDYPYWVTMDQMHNYLLNYASHFKLWPYFRFGHETVSVYPINLEQTQWCVINRVEGQIKAEIFDGVVVCTGLNQHENIPAIPGLDTFQGVQLHSKEYHTPEVFRDQRVLVIGVGESGFELGHQVALVSRETILSHKNGLQWFPLGAYQKGDCPCDEATCAGFFNEGMPFDTCLTNLEYLMPEVVQNFWQTKVAWFVIAHAWGEAGHGIKALQPPRANVFATYLVKSMEFLDDLKADKVRIVSWPERVEGQTVYFTNGESADVDVILFCTGYKPVFPFLAYSGVDTRQLYKNMVPHHTHNLAFVGFARPTFGSILPISEMQSMWVCSYFENNLPHLADRIYKREIQPLKVDHGRLKTLVIMNTYTHDLAKDMGIYPHLTRIFWRDPFLWFCIIFGPVIIPMYRLQGDFALPHMAEFIKEKNWRLIKNRNYWNHSVLLVVLLLHLFGGLPIYIYRRLRRLWYFMIGQVGIPRRESS